MKKSRFTLSHASAFRIKPAMANTRFSEYGRKTKKCLKKNLLSLLVFAIFVFLVEIYILEYNTYSEDLLIKVEKVLQNEYVKGFLIKTEGCQIPYQKALNPTIEEFIYKENVPICNNGTPPLFDSNLTSIFLLNSSLANYIDQDSSMLHCCYQPFYRQEPDKDEVDDKIKFSKKCISFNTSAKINEEFIRVKCEFNNSVIYTDFFSFVPVKTQKPNFETKPLNVLIIGLDAVSRLNFHRQMPKTAEYLKNLSAVELLGYNKVGDNTFPNLMPVLTGLSEKQLEKVCWNKEHYFHFDECPFIWKKYKSKGFVTSFGEDSTWMGIFNYQRKGFIKQPTDYSWGYFDQISETEIGNSHNLNVKECVGARQVYIVFLKYIQNFVTRMEMENLPYFAFYWGASLSHDYLNKPNLGDNDHRKFFEQLQNKGYLNNTILIFMSDHGIRWGDIRQTYQGQMEERLPFVFFVLPDWYRKQYEVAYINLIRNSRRLTTPYDLHETLKDLLNPFNLTSEFLTNRYNNESRRYSLFSNIPKKRTCKSADIDNHWCTCQQSVEVDISDPVVLKAAQFAVASMNKQLEGYAQCANLILNNVTQARLMTHNNIISTERRTKDYMITLETVPGNAIFEVTVRRRTREKQTNQFEVVGTISRLNLYGEQSACMSDFHLKLYCYCKRLLFA